MTSKLKQISKEKDQLVENIIKKIHSSYNFPDEILTIIKTYYHLPLTVILKRFDQKGLDSLIILRRDDQNPEKFFFDIKTL